MPPGSMETVEETLNAMLDAEADRLCRAERYNQTTASSKVRKTLDTTRRKRKLNLLLGSGVYCLSLWIFLIFPVHVHPQRSPKTGHRKGWDIDSERSPYRLPRHEQCLERREKAASYRPRKARMVFTAHRGSDRCP